MDRMSFAEQDVEEQFDQQLLKAIQATIIPHIGNWGISDSVTVSAPRTALEDIH